MMTYNILYYFNAIKREQRGIKSKDNLFHTSLRGNLSKERIIILIIICLITKKGTI